MTCEYVIHFKLKTTDKQDTWMIRKKFICCKRFSLTEIVWAKVQQKLASSVLKKNVDTNNRLHSLLPDKLWCILLGNKHINLLEIHK